MLEDYYAHDGYDDEAKHKRLLAVQAALEIIVSSAGSGSSAQGGSMANDLTWAKQEVSDLADAIQEALNK
ncbi:hypothetical protein [Providencia vermicola]|uniref:hypothetical protein n=1 Tax=Providencia vermicola TaxID=333965 RepID=UPI002880F807